MASQAGSSQATGAVASSGGNNHVLLLGALLVGLSAGAAIIFTKGQDLRLAMAEGGAADEAAAGDLEETQGLTAGE